MKFKYYNKLKRMGWFYPMLALTIDGKTYYQSPSKISIHRLTDILWFDAKPVLFTWDNRLWFK